MIEYLITINLISFITYGLDKYFAIKQKQRVPEKVLILLSIVGGSIGSLLGMILFHHKTKKIKFITLNPIILVIQIILYLYTK
ncbi:MAG: DUF1294 domain-containing protein [Bacilli bacterium]|nr:DUF1294 domain-containing protein [Bacilli bacterium]